jgi:plastocyanin
VRIKTADIARIRRIPMLALLALAVGMLALAGCGGSKGTSSSAATPAETPSTESTASTTTSTTAPSTGTLSLAADPEGQLKYDKSSLSAKAGQVSIDFTNSSPLSHNVTVESSSGSVVGATPNFQGASKTLKLTLKPGTYKFFCSIPGHRQAGMEGTLTVK